MQHISSPIMIHDALGFPASNQQAMHLEHYLQSQEAARCFEDDLDFCPSLTATELVNILKESASTQKRHQARRQQQDHMSSSCPSSPSGFRITATKPLMNHRPASKAIAIVDPNSKTPVQLPGSVQNPGEVATAITTTTSSPLLVAKPRHGSFSSESSVGSTESFSVSSDVSTPMDSSIEEVHDVALLGWSFQQQQQHLQNMHQMQQQQQHWHQQPHFMNDELFFSSPSSSWSIPQQEMINPSMGMFSPLTMAF
ncbi:hypothetical protein BGX21_006265 [Mortierella sp. AD011]|nr:hypothetical protein BGX20_007191 [Mortierella sp. AD010]KAF9399427.1 hypothetical protein BGX21_006265 [Mortierella sp. AD011]